MDEQDLLELCSGKLGYLRSARTGEEDPSVVVDELDGIAQALLPGLTSGVAGFQVPNDTAGRIYLLLDILVARTIVGQPHDG